MAAPLSTSCLQRWTLLQEAAQCSGVLEGWETGLCARRGHRTRLCLRAPHTPALSV